MFPLLDVHFCVLGKQLAWQLEVSALKVLFTLRYTLQISRTVHQTLESSLRVLRDFHIIP